MIYDEVDDTAGKRFAIIVDEAHSSQTGESAMKAWKNLQMTTWNSILWDREPSPCSIPAQHIYGFTFEGEKCLIRKG